MIMLSVLQREIQLNRTGLHPETLGALEEANRVAKSKTATIAACAAAQARLTRVPGTPKALHPLLDLAYRCVQHRRSCLEQVRSKAELSFNKLESRGRLV